MGSFSPWKLSFAAMSLLLLGSNSPAEEKLLSYGITGLMKTAPGQPGYFDTMKHREVQQLLLDVAAMPRSADYVDAALKPSRVARPDLEKLGLIRLRGESYVLSFTLITKQDIRQVRTVADKYAQSLAAALLQRRGDIEKLLQQYAVSGADSQAVCFIILGCFALDWDGLELTAAKGYRTEASTQRGAAPYIPWAEEKNDLSLQGIYWGSHNDDFDSEITFTSFGDHYSMPRYAFPDLVWSLAGRAGDDPTPKSLKLGVREMTRASLAGTGRQVGRMMLALRDGPKTASELAKAAAMPQEQAQKILALLKELQYVAGADGRYHAIIPVLAQRDLPMVRQIRRIASDVMEQWLATNYSHIKDDLREITPLRSGVPYATAFTQIWHYLFASANRQLVQAGLFADPYAATRKYKGNIPAVWHTALKPAK
jgi:hypothetical protein